VCNDIEMNNNTFNKFNSSLERGCPLISTDNGGLDKMPMVLVACAEYCTLILYYI
jgi:hypothetical protein